MRIRWWFTSKPANGQLNQAGQHLARPRSELRTHLLKASAVRTLPGYEAAVRAGALFRRRTLRGADMLAAEQVAELLGLDESVVHTMRNQRTLFAISNNGRSIRFPSWQFEVMVQPSMAPMLDVLKRLDEWAIFLFLVQRNPLLNSQSPVQLMLAGEAAPAMQAAQSYAWEMA